MTQLPFPSSSAGPPYASQATPNPQMQVYDLASRVLLSSSDVGAASQRGGAPFPVGHPGGAAASPTANGGAWSEYSGQPAIQTQGILPAGYASHYQGQQPFPATVTSPVQSTSPFPAVPTQSYPPHAAPQYAPTISATPASHPHPHPLPQLTAIDTAAAAMQAHYRTLVAHYWSYAQQGFSAPLTAEIGSEERERQVKARKEAVDWARQVGITVQEAENEVVVPGLSQARERAGSRPLPPAPALPAEGRERTTSRPLPVAPSGSAAPPPVPSLPATYRPISATTISPNLGRSASLANPLSPSASSGGSLARSVSDAVPPSTTPSPALVHLPASLAMGGKRPLPIPPPGRTAIDGPAAPAIAQLESGMSRITISAAHPPPPRSASPEPSPGVPSISLSDSPTSSTSGPPIPTFSFGSGDGEEDDDAHVPSAPAVPSFSFGGPDDEDEHPPSSSAKPVLHPRHDPSHPSHHLYHPTSVSSPLPPPSTSTSSGSLSSLTSRGGPAAEAGTITCTACHAPIFGRVLVALDREWHPACFVCAEEGCGLRLEVMEFEGTPEDWVDDQIAEEEQDGGGASSEEDDEDEEEVQDSSEDEEGWVKAPRVVVEGAEDEASEKKRRKRKVRRGETLKGKAWCMVHFEERFALHCHNCHTPIASADYLPITDPLLPPSSSSTAATASSSSAAKTRYYHPLHFFCAGCGDTFIDPVAYERTLHPSTSAAPSSGLEVKPYFAREGHPYCEACDLRMWRPKCPGCRKGLREEDGFLEVPLGAGEQQEGEAPETQRWHEGCFKCSRCSRPLTSIYLLRLETTLVPRTRKQGGGLEEVQEERPYCAECYDVRAKAEAETSVARERGET
ncbi:hypothetical protein JCM11251_005578 [Rhodosporidiobolus azoricus]